MHISSMWNFFPLEREPIVCIRFSKVAVKQKDLKLILYGIN